MTQSEFDGAVAMGVNEVAKLLGISRAGLSAAVKRGEVPSRRLGKRVIIPAAALREFLTVPQAA